MVPIVNGFIPAAALTAAVKRKQANLPKKPNSSFFASSRLTEAENPLMMEKLVHGDRRPAAVAANAAA
jgi:hypothetical protein